MGKVDVLQFHTFGTPCIKSCSCCGSKESSRGPKSRFWARIYLEHTFMLINVSTNWLSRWRIMQNRWSTVQTHSVLMVFEAKIGICWISGSKVDLGSELRSSSDISTLFFTKSVFYDVSLIFDPFWEPFSHSRGQIRFGACFIALNACSKLTFLHVF